ncbi:TerB N-terminal domain-containing protein [Paenibacillus barcinonensis]|uniref:TerB N-terminal domain-containing protein n=1 Tax=Paenibacillus barcinonensis TaxID=198119 RepID=A0A2V4VCH0_PAEBA|nr:TerB N-terminal domain-containing protein [Paenibacillus barcinonensis]PYE50268.1 TerB-like protein [Paenibacillus barcinonensis]QKS54952.1 TerB N-terminal domain-containing protein [Paenibacillus barcinonensis]
MRDHSEQLEFMEIEMSDEIEPASVRIPDRSTLAPRSREPRVLPGSVLSSEKRFVEEARRLAETTEEETLPVPFMSYWPTYGVMNDAQLRWYLYWRTEVRQGNYLDVDLSYLFVHIYELINGIGWLYPEQGYEQLKQLWIHYREHLPQLNPYMQEWMVDFVLVHELQPRLQEVMQLAGGYLPAPVLDKELQRMLQENTPVLTLEMLQRYYDYDISLNTFYRDGGKEVMERFIPQVMAVAHAYLKRTRSHGLLPEMNPEAELTIERTLFRKAVYDESIYGRSVSFTYFPLGEQKDFVQRLTRMYRCTENKLRELLGFRGRLRGKTLEPELARVIERYIEKMYSLEQTDAEHAPVIQIDTAKLASLQEDSEYVRRALTIEETAPSEYDAASAAFEPEAIEPYREQMVAAPWSMEQHDEPNQEQSKAIAAASDEGAEMNELLQAQAKDTAESEVQLQRQDDISSAKIELQWHESAEASLQQEWHEFAEQLEPRHVKAIHVLLGDRVDAELICLANEIGTMPALLLDEINDIAMETIGDLLIDGDRIAPDYMDVFEHVKRCEL